MKKIIVGNWKMNPQTQKEAIFLLNLIEKNLKKKNEILKKIEIVICPPFVYLPLFQRKNLKIKLGAQDSFWEERGPFTSQISPLMLKNLNCEYVILGHSEKRTLGETDEMINKKIKTALKNKLKPIFCLGETEKEKKEGKTKKVLEKQLTLGLKGISKNDFNFSNLFLAYEPVWAIGSGCSCPPKEANSILVFLRKITQKIFSFPIKILYGGSVISENAPEYLKEGFDGLLVGGASLKVKEFLGIIENCFTFLKSKKLN